MSNSVNVYEFIGFITLNIEVHELVYVYSFLVDRISVSNVPWATVLRNLCLETCPLKPKKPNNLITFFKTIGFYQPCFYPSTN